MIYRENAPLASGRIRREGNRPLIQRWDVITIGNLSRNRYWSEGDDQAVRPALCTSTLIRGQGICLLVDPPLADPERMAFELSRRVGLAPADVTTVFLTHAHGDHTAGLDNFPQAEWLAAPDVAARLTSARPGGGSIRPAGEAIANCIAVVPTPGHTRDHHSLQFECDGLRVVVAGDAVMTRDFWQDRQGFFNSVDFKQAARTMDDLAQRADIIVPGHDNYFLLRP